MGSRLTEIQWPVHWHCDGMCLTSAGSDPSPADKESYQSTSRDAGLGVDRRRCTVHTAYAGAMRCPLRGESTDDSEPLGTSFPHST